MSKREPMTEYQIDELGEWLRLKLSEDIELISEHTKSGLKRLYYEVQRGEFWVYDGAVGMVGGYLESLTDAVRAFEAHVPMVQRKLKL